MLIHSMQNLLSIAGNTFLVLKNVQNLSFEFRLIINIYLIFFLRGSRIIKYHRYPRSMQQNLNFINNYTNIKLLLLIKIYQNYAMLMQSTQYKTPKVCYSFCVKSKKRQLLRLQKTGFRMNLSQFLRSPETYSKV